MSRLCSDAIDHILSMTNDGTTYKQLLLVCQRWYKYFIPHNYWKSKFINNYWDMIQNIDEDRWNWRTVSKHKMITMDIIRKFPNKPWRWDILPSRFDFDESLILQFPEKSWQYHDMTNLVSTDVIITLHHKSWNYPIVQHRLSMNFIMTHPYYTWSYFHLSSDERVPIHFIQLRHGRDWNWKKVSKHKDLTINMVLDLYDKEWDWEYLLEKFGFKESLKFVANTKVGFILSSHKEITMKIIEENDNVFWDQKKVCTNPVIPVEHLMQSNYEWDYYYISKHPSLTCDHIKENPDRGWNFDYISKHLFK